MHKLDMPGMRTDFDLPSIFSPTVDLFAEEKKDVETEEQPTAVPRMNCHTRTFTLWRPFEGCKRCKNAIEKGYLILPEDEGDYTCKHVQRKEYEEIINKIMRGRGIKQHEEFFMLGEGVRCVQIVWLEPDPEYLKELKAQQKKKEENRVYPPNPEKVFSQPVKKDGRAPTKKNARPPHKVTAGSS